MMKFISTNPAVFNIGSNKVRLIAAIHYNRKKIYIRAILIYRAIACRAGKY
jgi:mRNA-degrading endonuclease HigB of HigAB toxin-antitoxin module